MSGREDLILNPDTEFDERFEAVMVDMLNGKHSSQIHPSHQVCLISQKNMKLMMITPHQTFKYLSLYKSHYIMSRRTDLLQQLIQSDKFGEEKEQEQKFLAATAELILTDLINIAMNGVQQRGAGSLVINLQNDSTTFMSGDDIEYDIATSRTL